MQALPSSSALIISDLIMCGSAVLTACWWILSRAACADGGQPHEQVGVSLSSRFWQGEEVPLARGAGWNPKRSGVPTPGPPVRGGVEGGRAHLVFDGPALTPLQNCVPRPNWHR